MPVLPVYQLSEDLTTGSICVQNLMQMSITFCVCYFVMNKK